jgi:NADH:ubiquinone oxidoreductase subunit E
MGGFDTKGRFHVHWGAAEQFAERREGSALRRSGRPVPDPAYEHFGAVDLEPVDGILKKYDYDRNEMLAILESVQDVYGYLPVAAMKRISDVSGAPYALIYGTATYYSHLHFQKPGRTVAVCFCTACLLAGSSRIARTLAGEFGTEIGRGPGGGDVSLQRLPSHIRGGHAPLVTLDGKPQTVSHSGAAAWARALAGRTTA